MPLPKSLIANLALCALPLLVMSCGPQVTTKPVFPPRADLAVEAKPIPPIEIVTSERAALQHQAAKDAWGERGWRTVGRLCRFFQGHGMVVNGQPIECPAPAGAE